MVLRFAVASRTSAAFQFANIRRLPHLPVKTHPTTLCGSRNRKINIVQQQHLHSAFLLSDIESQATTAIETWSIESTPFLEPNVANQVQELFQHRGDVTVYRVVGGRRTPSQLTDNDYDGDSTATLSNGEGRRSRFILFHPDLGLDIASAERDYCAVLRIQNVNLASSNTFPNALASIGIPLELVGDIIITSDNTNNGSGAVAYMVVDPTISKRIQRLLSKELVGTGISLELCDDNEFMPSGVVQEMKLSKVLERRVERKKYEQGYVAFHG
jgi:RNA-binding protein YlmH